VTRRPLTTLLAAAILTGCGASDLSDPQLRSQASQICRSAARQIAVIPGPVGARDPAVFLHRGRAVLEPELARLRALHPPPSAAPHLAVALRAFAAELAAVRAAQARIRHGTDAPTAYGALSRRAAPLEARAGTEWRALGIPACASATH
jgi:hypothetical protein